MNMSAQVPKKQARNRPPKNVTLSEYALTKGEERAKQLGKSFSAYVEDLIRRDVDHSVKL